MLSALRYGSQDLILPGCPVALQAYRSPVDNDAWIRGQGGREDEDAEHEGGVFRREGRRHFPGVARITAQFRTKGSDLSFSGEVAWTVFGNGIINASVRMYPSAKGEELLRLGVTFGIPAAYDQVEYLGLGPWDNYRDRRTSCWKDVFRTSVDDMFLPIPGPRTWATAWRRTGWPCPNPRRLPRYGWVPPPRAPLEVSVLRYTPKELNNAKSLDRLPEKDKVIVNLDAFQMGWAVPPAGRAPWQSTRR